MTVLCLQIWYEGCEAYRYHLTDDDFWTKASGEGWGTRIMKTSERVLEQLILDQKRFQDDMMEEQAAFEANVGELENVRVACPCYCRCRMLCAVEMRRAGKTCVACCCCCCR